MIIAGEASGDQHGAHLVDELKKSDPSLTFSGIGGQMMKESGVAIDYDLTKIAIIGFLEVLKHYLTFRKAFYGIIKKVKERKPQAVVLIDYPGFNLRLAKKLRGLGVKIIYYISPQVWAWKKNRVYFIKKHIDRMLVIFQFEKAFYAKHGVDVEFVGHPLIDEIKIGFSKQEILSILGLHDYKLTIGLLPGSRPKEIERHLPVMIEAARILLRKYPMTQFVIVKAPTIEEKTLEAYIPPDMKISIWAENPYDGISACDLCMVCSGTATLETAILNKPMVVVYITSWITYTLAKKLVKIPNIGLVNVVADKQIVPECIQQDATGAKIAKELEAIMINEPRILDIKDELFKVKESLGGGGASQRAAGKILEVI